MMLLVFTKMLNRKSNEGWQQALTSRVALTMNATSFHPCNSNQKQVWSLLLRIITSVTACKHTHASSYVHARTYLATHIALISCSWNPYQFGFNIVQEIKP